MLFCNVVDKSAITLCAHAWRHWCCMERFVLMWNVITIAVTHFLFAWNDTWTTINIPCSCDIYTCKRHQIDNQHFVLLWKPIERQQTTVHWRALLKPYEWTYYCNMIWIFSIIVWLSICILSYNSLTKPLEFCTFMMYTFRVVESMSIFKSSAVYHLVFNCKNDLISVKEDINWVHTLSTFPGTF